MAARFRCSWSRPRRGPRRCCATAATIILRPCSVSAAQVLSVHGDRRMGAAPDDGDVQRLGRQGGEDVVEGGDRGRGVALLGLQTHRPPRSGEQGGELSERRRPPVAGAGRRRRPRARSKRLPRDGGTRAPRPDTRRGCAAGAPSLLLERGISTRAGDLARDRGSRAKISERRTRETSPIGCTATAKWASGVDEL